MSTRLEVKYCQRCKLDRVVEVETIYFVPIVTSTCQSCGHTTTSEPEPVRRNRT